MRKYLIAAVLALVVLALVGQVRAATEAELLKLRVQAATEVTISMALPWTSDHTIKYDPEKKVVVYKFNSEIGREPNYALFYQRWWDAQFIALSCFEEVELKVIELRVITNFHDGSGYMLANTLAPFVRKFANAKKGMTSWLSMTDCYLWDEKEKKWNKLAK